MIFIGGYVKISLVIYTSCNNSLRGIHFKAKISERIKDFK